MRDDRRPGMYRVVVPHRWKFQTRALLLASMVALVATGCYRSMPVYAIPNDAGCGIRAQVRDAELRSGFTSTSSIRLTALLINEGDTEVFVDPTKWYVRHSAGYLFQFRGGHDDAFRLAPGLERELILSFSTKAQRVKSGTASLVIVGSNRASAPLAPLAEVRLTSKRPLGWPEVTAGHSQRCPIVQPATVDAAEENVPLAQDPASTPAVSSGTCFAVAPDGLVATAAHVVENADEIAIRVASGAEHPASVVSVSTPMDLAVLRIDVPTPSYLFLADSGAMAIGAPVFTVGHPAPEILGSEPKYSEGSVSALSGPRGDAMFMQVTVPIQPGNSGGPLLNEGGAVVGVMVASLRASSFLGATGALPQNVNYAIKGELLRTLLPTLPQGAPAPTPRPAAIQRALSAVCMVIARSHRSPSR